MDTHQQRQGAAAALAHLIDTAKAEAAQSWAVARMGHTPWRDFSTVEQAMERWPGTVRSDFEQGPYTGVWNFRPKL